VVSFSQNQASWISYKYIADIILVINSWVNSEIILLSSLYLLVEGIISRVMSHFEIERAKIDQWALN
jgi:hypothetical protein